MLFYLTWKVRALLTENTQRNLLSPLQSSAVGFGVTGNLKIHAIKLRMEGEGETYSPGLLRNGTYSLGLQSFSAWKT